ncbi:RISC-loading complex subunit tarbp2-like isoform X2 [Sipha flava]|jgi:dsRNA-specific ribonuclease|nr:RISC-loading complex subunit tarbp2-like isoform X2 [Sipha flava]
MNQFVRLDLQAHISSLNKTPASIVQEYAAKNHLVPQYNIIHNGISQSKVTFKYSLALGNYETVGEGSSKKEAKHEAALKILKLMIKDNPQLLETEFKHWDFDNHVVSPFDNNIKVNAIGQLNEICANNKLALPEFRLVREEGQAHAKLFTISCHLSKMVEIATHKTKKQAKHLSAVQMVKRFQSLEQSLVMEPEKQNTDSLKVLDQVELIKTDFVRKNGPIDENVSNYHLLFKQTEWLNTETLDNVVKQYVTKGQLNISNPLEVLNTIVEECGMILVEKVMNKTNICTTFNQLVLGIDNVYPPIFGIGLNNDINLAKNMAATHLLENICILSI